MSLYGSRRCLDIAGRIAGGSSVPARTWSTASFTLVIQRRCYANPTGAQKLKERPAVNASPPPSTSRTSGKAQKPQDAAKEPKETERTTEEELRNVETLYRMSETNQVDVSSAPLDLLDVIIPSWKSQKENATLADHWRAFTQTQRNWFWNARSLYLMAQTNSIPGVKVKSAWSRQLFSTSSTKPDTWLAPFRQAVLEVYKQVNEAVATRDEKTLKTLTAGEQQKAYMKLIRSQDPRFANVWKFHGERSPAQVVSIRAIEAYYGSTPPRMGSRLAIQAVVRFDTMQSVESYSKKTGARVGATEPKPVVEYLVFQKRMWYDSPWIIRDRLYEGLDSRLKKPQI
ncbi:hypothetical protein DICSQDRAFT_108332 [Dichomitus squalens LYAD-421 SS1]|uniref:Tim44-like domain-containing protein n=1 Tax=Dichomitus squalens (strain LYAD-421) TaxID=732165 RepID=R7SUL0_DICSQ|nr:uncharacterized protein DICSQDRAFT_108332 [Dichomitus squalens LYAD-421 SS1]EJF59726.1 hypothetical protein DICSQDRAFT_108332 [Dichomitus squalens LYAD-421 SS1]